MKMVLKINYESDFNWEMFNPKNTFVHSNSGFVICGKMYYSSKSFQRHCPILLNFFERMKYENKDTD
jgi:hypothetical protein